MTATADRLDPTYALAMAFAWVTRAHRRGGYELRVALLHLRDRLPLCPAKGPAANDVTQ